MKATNIIARDHRAIEALYKKFKSAKEDKRAVEHDLFAALTAHETMEDKHFYAALKEKNGEDETLKVLDHEQTTLKLGAMAAHVKETMIGPDKETLEKVMARVLAHAKKEEKVLFPMAEKILGPVVLEELGTKMEPLSAVAKSSA